VVGMPLAPIAGAPSVVPYRLERVLFALVRASPPPTSPA
jgi:predicted component of type VI protein secretion system